MRRPPWWASLLGGAGAGVLVAAFVVVPWPWGLIAVPVVAGWLLLIRRLGRLPMAVTGVVTVVLGAGVVWLLASLG